MTEIIFYWTVQFIHKQDLILAILLFYDVWVTFIKCGFIFCSDDSCVELFIMSGPSVIFLKDLISIGCLEQGSQDRDLTRRIVRF
jgi:hypothetical protein